MTSAPRWVTIPLSKLFRKRREGDAVPSSREQAPDRATTVPTVPRTNRGDASRRRITLATIAAEAGVSLPTVSKVVNRRPDVAAATRAKVERLLDQHHYLRAGTRRQRRSGLIDLVFNGLECAWGGAAGRHPPRPARRAAAQRGAPPPPPPRGGGGGGPPGPPPREQLAQ